jgi:hypothetical protein
MHRESVRVMLTAVQPQPMKVLTSSGLAAKLGAESFCASSDEALDRAAEILAGRSPAKD